MIGAIFVEFASWRWVFWFVAIVAIPIGLLCTFIVPNPTKTRAIDESAQTRWKSLDIAGVSILTGMLQSSNFDSRDN